MQKTTVIKIVAEIKANYRYTYKGATDAEIKLIIERWYDCLHGFSDAEVEEAFKAAICTLTLPPTLADIIGYIERKQRLSEPNDNALWQELMYAIGESSQTQWTHEGFLSLYEIGGKALREIYDKMSEPMREYVDYDSFQYFCGMSKESLEFERSRFLKQIPEIRRALRERALTEGDFEKLSSAHLKKQLESKLKPFDGSMVDIKKITGERK